jgi:HEAT repeat-containing protein 5
LIAFVTNTETEDPENARALVVHALTVFATTLSGTQKGVAMSVIVPTLLARANSAGEEVYRETSARLLDLAGSDQPIFRSVVAGMTDAQRQFMESVIVAGRQAGQAQGKAKEGDGEDKEPTIALRMDFGG